MLLGKFRYRQFLSNKAKRLNKRSLRFKEKHKLRLSLKYKGYVYINHPERAYKKCIRKQIIELTLPASFNILINKQEVFGFVSSMLNMHALRKVKQINLNLEEVLSIDFPAICLLLSVVKELSNNGIKVIGNYPQNEFCKKVFIESGFLKQMIDDNGKPFEIETENFIVETGHNKTRNKDIANAIMTTMESFEGYRRRFQPAYTIIMEICSNSVEHAYQNRPKHWRLGIYHEEDKISFTMTDTGVGILNTLHRKFWKLFKDKVTYQNEIDILYKAFERKYGSSTTLVNRNKGLPCILDKLNRKYIKNLKVYTNNVCLDFTNKKDSILLENDFKGVLFYWEIDKECISNFDNDKLNNDNNKY